MGVITNLVTRVEAIKGLCGISEVIYDETASVDWAAENTYPLLVFRVMNDSTDEQQKTNEDFNLVIDFFISDITPQGDNRTNQEVQDELRENLNQLIKSIPKSDNVFHIVGSSSGEFAWSQHNDNAMVYKKSVTIRAFKCTVLVDQ